jgi:hypothetical protein
MKPDLSGEQDIIAIEVLDGLAASNPPNYLAGQARPAVRPVDHPNLGRVVPRECICDRAGRVSRAIVDEDNLDRAICLPEHAFDSLTEKNWAVEDRNDPTDQPPG